MFPVQTETHSEKRKEKLIVYWGRNLANVNCSLWLFSWSNNGDNRSDWRGHNGWNTTDPWNRRPWKLWNHADWRDWAWGKTWAHHSRVWAGITRHSCINTKKKAISMQTCQTGYINLSNSAYSSLKCIALHRMLNQKRREMIRHCYHIIQEYKRFAAQARQISPAERLTWGQMHKNNIYFMKLEMCKVRLTSSMSLNTTFSSYPR